MSAALVALVHGLVRAAEEGWGGPVTPLSLAASPVLLAALFAVDRRATQPLLPVRVFADRRRAGGFLGLLLAAVLTGFLFHLAQYLYGALGFGPLRAGLALLPFGPGTLLTVQVLNSRLSHVGSGPRALLGLTLVVAAVLWLTRLDGHSAYAPDMLPQITLLGVGVGLALVPLHLTILSIDHAPRGHRYHGGPPSGGADGGRHRTGLWYGPGARRVGRRDA